jgi:4-hydroxy-2-oxoheptanedioate aldolase
MDIKKRDFLGLGVGAAGLLAATGAMAQSAETVAAATAAREARARGDRIRVGDGGGPVNSGVQPSTVDLNYKPRRLNKAIELWEDGQPIYYQDSGLGAGVDPYAQGVRMARTYMDAINVEMEHGVVDILMLREFMRGLVDGGPTRSGHRTPAVFVETGIIGLDEAYARANTWLIEQYLDAGVHGIHVCHARDAKAIQVISQMGMRYPFLDRPNVPNLPMRGLRGSSAGYAAQIWGVNQNKYCHLADLWPFNPRGELILGVKIEDTIADLQAEQTLSLPGVAFAEGGGGDHGYWVYGLSVMNEDGTRGTPKPEDAARFQAAMQNVIALCKKHNIHYLAGASTDPNAANFVHKAIDGGMMVIESGEDVAIMGREYSKRKMPV